MTRKLEREQAFILIFEKCFRDDELSDILDDAVNADAYKPNEYSEKCFRGVYENVEKIDEIISANLNGWQLSRISKVALSILRLAVFEIENLDDIPESVSINEAVELSKKYATIDDASYINGVLGSIVRAR